MIKHHQRSPKIKSWGKNRSKIGPKSVQNRYGRYADRRKFPAAHRRVVKEHGAVPGTSDKLAAKVVGPRASIAITAIQLIEFQEKDERAMYFLLYDTTIDLDGTLSATREPGRTC